MGWYFDESEPRGRSLSSISSNIKKEYFSYGSGLLSLLDWRKFQKSFDGFKQPGLTMCFLGLHDIKSLNENDCVDLHEDKIINLNDSMRGPVTFKDVYGFATKGIRDSFGPKLMEDMLFAAIVLRSDIMLSGGADACDPGVENHAEVKTSCRHIDNVFESLAVAFLPFLNNGFMDISLWSALKQKADEFGVGYELKNMKAVRRAEEDFPGFENAFMEQGEANRDILYDEIKCFVDYLDRSGKKADFLICKFYLISPYDSINHGPAIPESLRFRYSKWKDNHPTNVSHGTAYLDDYVKLNEFGCQREIDSLCRINDYLWHEVFPAGFRHTDFRIGLPERTRFFGTMLSASCVKDELSGDGADRFACKAFDYNSMLRFDSQSSVDKWIGDKLKSKRRNCLAGVVVDASLRHGNREGGECGSNDLPYKVFKARTLLYAALAEGMKLKEIDGKFNEAGCVKEVEDPIGRIHVCFPVLSESISKVESKFFYDIFEDHSVYYYSDSRRIFYKDIMTSDNPDDLFKTSADVIKLGLSLLEEDAWNCNYSLGWEECCRSYGSMAVWHDRPVKFAMTDDFPSLCFGREALDVWLFLRRSDIDRKIAVLEGILTEGKHYVLARRKIEEWQRNGALVSKYEAVVPKGKNCLISDGNKILVDSETNELLVADNADIWTRVVRISMLSPDSFYKLQRSLLFSDATIKGLDDVIPEYKTDFDKMFHFFSDRISPGLIEVE